MPPILDTHKTIAYAVGSYGREYSFADHLSLSSWLFSIERWEHSEEAITILHSMYMTKKAQAWGPLFGPTQHLWQLPPFIGDVMNADHVAVLIERSQQMMAPYMSESDIMDIDAILAGDKTPDDQAFSLPDFQGAQLERINGLSAARGQSLRYAAMARLPGLQSSYSPCVMMRDYQQGVVFDISLAMKLAYQADVSDENTRKRDVLINQAVAEISTVRTGTTVAPQSNIAATFLEAAAEQCQEAENGCHFTCFVSDVDSTVNERRYKLMIKKDGRGQTGVRRTHDPKISTHYQFKFIAGLFSPEGDTLKRLDMPWMYYAYYSGRPYLNLTPMPKGQLDAKKIATELVATELEKSLPAPQ